MLIEFKAECGSVRLDRLFDPDPEAEIDVYGIFDKMHNESSVEYLKREHCLEDHQGALIIKACPQLEVKSIKPNCSWGFAVLIDLLDEHISMEESLTVRVSETDGVLEPGYMDLMIWAVLVGSRDMARELWGQTTDPLRAALVASLVCRQIAVRIFHKVGHEAETLLADADFYEDYAFGIIDKAEEKEARRRAVDAADADARDDDDARGRARAATRGAAAAATAEEDAMAGGERVGSRPRRAGRGEQ